MFAIQTKHESKDENEANYSDYKFRR